MVALRAERARLLGYRHLCRVSARRLHGEDAARGARPARRGLAAGAASARSPTATRCRRWSQAEGGNFKIAPWDWRYYAEKLRKKLHDVDEAAIKPYLQLDKIIEAAFDTATRLFGLRFKELNDMPVWHPDVRVWEVTDAGGQPCRACSSAIISRAPPSIAAPG